MTNFIFNDEEIVILSLRKTVDMSFTAFETGNEDLKTQVWKSLFDLTLEYSKVTGPNAPPQLHTPKIKSAEDTYFVEEPRLNLPDPVVVHNISQGVDPLEAFFEEERVFAIEAHDTLSTTQPDFGEGYVPAVALASLLGVSPDFLRGRCSRHYGALSFPGFRVKKANGHSQWVVSTKLFKKARNKDIANKLIKYFQLNNHLRRKGKMRDA